MNKASAQLTVIAVYVDDILIIGSDYEEIQHVKQHLNEKFGIKDLGKLHYFLGLEVSHTAKGILLSQQKFTRYLLRDCGFHLKQTASTPLPLNCKLLPDEGTLLDDLTVYRTLVRKLNFLTHTRPDLAFTVQTLSRSISPNTKIQSLTGSFADLDLYSGNYGYRDSIERSRTTTFTGFL